MQYIIGACYHAFSLPKIRDNNNGPITPQHTLKIEGMQFVMLSTMLCVQKMPTYYWIPRHSGFNLNIFNEKSDAHGEKNTFSEWN